MQLVANRPDVRQAERNLAQAFYATNVARAAFYPSISLSGTIGWMNNGGGIVANSGQWLLNAIGSLTQPLFNRGTNIANLRIAEAQQEEAKLLFRQSLLDAGKEVNNALTAWQTANGQIEIADSQVDTPHIWKFSPLNSHCLMPNLPQFNPATTLSKASSPSTTHLAAVIDISRT